MDICKDCQVQELCKNGNVCLLSGVSQNNYNVKDDKIEKVLKTIAERVNTFLPEGWGFTLLLFEMNKENPSVFYISKAERADMIKLLQEFVNRNVN